MTSSVVYPYRHHHHHHTPHQHHHQTQSLQRPPSSRHNPHPPPSRPVSSLQHSQFAYRPRRLRPPPYLHRPSHPSYRLPPTMATSDMSELEQMQRMSESYNPDLPGPLIGSKSPMSNLVTEYAQADPAFVMKTQALAASHSGYRPIKGDGQCGWRGTIFAYFEILLQLGDIQLVLQEETRLHSFDDTMRMAGIDVEIMVDMFDFTWNLFASLKTAIQNGDKRENVLLDLLNEINASNSIVYHFRMNPDNYEPFLEMPIHDYRVSVMEPVNQEIDQIGLQALTDAIIAQAGFALDVLYLDRSVGAEVTPHEFAPKNTGGSTISLLYRPGHYDLIYKGVQSVQVYLQKDSVVHHDLYLAEPSNLHPDLQDYIYPSSQSASSMPPSGSFGYDGQGSDSHRQHQQPSFFFPTDSNFMFASQYQSAPVQHNSYPPGFSQSMTSPCLSANTTNTGASSALSPSPHSPTSTGSVANNLPMPPVALSTPTNKTNNDNGPAIRLTQYVKQYERTGESVPLNTSAFGNAASLSTAHFRNQEFQPQMWRMEDEYGKH